MLLVKVTIWKQLRESVPALSIRLVVLEAGIRCMNFASSLIVLIGSCLIRTHHESDISPPSYIFACPPAVSLLEQGRREPAPHSQPAPVPQPAQSLQPGLPPAFPPAGPW
jgi:hypothetical protein